MSKMEHFMICWAFGSSIGLLLGCWGIVLKSKIDDIRKKKKDKKGK